MYKWILAMAVSCILLAGCGSAEMIGGAAVGGAAAHTLAGIQTDLQAQKEKLLIEMEAASELEREVLLKKIKWFEDMQTGVGLAVEATGTDWTNPNAVGGYAGAVVASLLAFYYRKKGIVIDSKYTAAKQGQAKFNLDNPEKAAELYSNIGEARAGLGV